MTDPHDQLAAYRESFDGCLQSQHLRPTHKDSDRLYYKCPCGSNTHFASRAIVLSDFGTEYGLSSVLHCYEHRRKWMIVTSPARIIGEEEARVQKLMARFEAKGWVGQKVSADEAFNRYTTHGCPPELLDIEDQPKFDSLMAQFRIDSKRAATND